MSESPSEHSPKDTHGKALSINLDASVFGTFAEIGGGRDAPALPDHPARPPDRLPPARPPVRSPRHFAAGSAGRTGREPALRGSSRPRVGRGVSPVPVGGPVDRSDGDRRARLHGPGLR